MNAYLIQRAKIEYREHKTGVDSILRFDYMGSAEFEWGALPKSLDIVRGLLDKYICFDTEVNGKALTVFCNQDIMQEVPEYLEGIYTNKFHLKEASFFDDVIDGTGYWKDRVNCWWDIGNHLFFWLKDDEFEKNFKIKIQPPIN